MNGEVVSVVSILGEIVGRLKSESETTVTLSDPRLFVQQEGGAGFAPGISMTGEANPAELTLNKGVILAVIPTHPDLVKGWSAATSGIVL